MTPDGELLREYAQSGDEAAFAGVVQRNLPLVYSAALRLTGDAHLAEDVTQQVFTDLARKARALSNHETLAGWLHTSTRYLSSKTMRSERRRQLREHEAAAMHEPNLAPEMNLEQLRPVLDEAVGQLRETDRNVVLLRFFQGKSYGEAAAALGMNENAVNKRVERALEKMRAHFARRGVTTTAALLASAITAHATMPLPPGLAAKVTGISLAGGGGAAVLWQTFLMNTKTKIITGAVILVLMLAVPGILIWQGDPSTDEPKLPEIPATSVVPMPPAATIQNAEVKAPDVARTPETAPTITREPVRVELPAPAAWTAGAYVASTGWTDAGADTPEKALQTFLWARKEGRNDRLIELRFETPIVARVRPDGQSSRPAPANATTAPRPASAFDPAKIAGTTVIAKKDISPTQVEITVEDKFTEPLPGFGEGAREIFNLQLADGVWKWRFTRLEPIKTATAGE